MAENAMTAAAAASSGARARIIEAHRLVLATPADRRGVFIIKARRRGEVGSETVVSIAGVLTEWREIMPELSTAGYYREIGVRARCSYTTVDKSVQIIIRALSDRDV